MSEIAPLSPRSNKFNQRSTRRYLESLTSATNDAIQFSEITGGFGLIAVTAAMTVVARTVQGVVNRTAVTNGGGVLGNPIIDIDSNYAGQTSITTLGTITTGDVSLAKSVNGNTSRNVKDKFIEIISVKDYGALGDGSDATIAIQAALNAAAALNPSGSGVGVYIPAGIYVISATINIPTTTASGICLYGSGRSTTTLHRAGTFTSGDIIYSTTVVNPLAGYFEIKDLTIINSNILMSSGASIHINNRSCFTISNILSVDGYQGVFCDGNCSLGIIDKYTYVQSSAFYVTRSGIEFGGGNQNGHIISNSSATSAGIVISAGYCLTNGLLIQASDGIQIINCYFSGNAGITLDANHGYTIDDVWCSNCVIDGCRTYGVILTGTAATYSKAYTNIRFIGCHIDPTNANGVLVNTTAVYIDGDCDYVQFIGCDIDISGGSLVYLNQPANSYAGVPIQCIQFLGSYFTLSDQNSTGTATISLKTGQNGVSIIGNYIGNRVSANASQYAISLDGSNANILIANNNLVNQHTAPIYFGAAVSSYTNLRIYANIGAHDVMGTVDLGVWNGTKIGLSYGGTNADLSATGGTSQVLKQTSVGGPVTVGQLALSDLSTGTTGTGLIVLNNTPTLITPLLGTPTSGVLTNCTGTASGLTAGTVTTNANLTGDVTSSGNATTLASVNSNIGSFKNTNITVNAKGLVTAASTSVYPKARAYLSTNQSINSGTATKVLFDAVTFDTNSNFDGVTNHRFTPTVAGKYLVSSSALLDTIATVETLGLIIYKTGSAYSQNLAGFTPGFAASFPCQINDTVDMNGSTDYLEIYAYQTSGVAKNINAGTGQTWVTFSLLP
jgi:hypothetical protein